MFGKLMFFTIIIALIYFLFFKKSDKKNKKSKKEKIENLVKCDECGIYVSATECVKRGEKTVCEKCRKEGK